MVKNGANQVIVKTEIIVHIVTLGQNNNFTLKSTKAQNVMMSNKPDIAPVVCFVLLLMWNVSDFIAALSKSSILFISCNKLQKKWVFHAMVQFQLIVVQI